MKRLLVQSLTAISLMIPTTSVFSQEREPVLLQEELDIPEKEVTEFGWPFDLYPSTHYPAALHWFASLSVLGDTIELEDGSIWRVAPADQKQLANWLHGDPIMITQNRSWCTSYELPSDESEWLKRWVPQKKYPFIILNKKTNGRLQARLQEGPFKGGAYSRYILSIDYTHREIKLTDNSHWSIPSYDEPTFKDWSHRDCIIIGFNSGWDSGFEAVLINVTRNNIVRAKQY